MKIFRGEQIKELDRYTIENEPVASHELMERAALKLFEWIRSRFDRSVRLIIFAGPGNNGGDALALGRLLAESRYNPEIYYVKYTENVSEDWLINRERIEKSGLPGLNVLEKIDQFPVICSDDIIIDGIFGTGLNRAAEGLAAEVIRQINKLECTVISIDIPSGLFCEDNSKNTDSNIIKADFTLSFQFTKLSFLFPENDKYVGHCHVLPIGLHPSAIREMMTPWQLIEIDDVRPILKSRKRFDHKGTFGHGLLIAGSADKMGAAVLSARAALRSGIGLITCLVPAEKSSMIQITVPEAMAISSDKASWIQSEKNIAHLTAAGIGPGIGTEITVQKQLFEFLSDCTVPLVLDADALNILSLNRELIAGFPAGTILTPHPGEFERLVGPTSDSYQRLLTQVSFSEKYKCIVVLKGAFTSVSLPDGRVMFNSTGNPGMATAGSGDVLTGIILSLLAQGYPSESAAIAGTFIHGLAGDIAAEKSCFESVIASDIIENIGNAFNEIRGREN